MLLWEEYATGNPLAYKYTSFCVKYAEFARRQQRSMRQIHIAGEKLFVDYAGDTVPIVDAATGEITQAQIFVATLGASNYTYACATPRQTTADWIGAQVQALEFIGGVPRLIVPDQTRALIKTPDRYDPEPNRTYEEFAIHYGCAVLAARPAHPRDLALGRGLGLAGPALDPGPAAQPPLLQSGRAEQGHRRAAG
jgi:transposase